MIHSLEMHDVVQSIPNRHPLIVPLWLLSLFYTKPIHIHPRYFLANVLALLLYIVKFLFPQQL